LPNPAVRQPGWAGTVTKSDEETMDRCVKLVGLALIASIAVSVAGCSTTGKGYAYEIASCKGGYPDASGIMNMSPYSPNADPFQPPCGPK